MLPDLERIGNQLPLDRQEWKPDLVNACATIEKFDNFWELLTTNSDFSAANPQEAQRALAYGSRCVISSLASS